METPYPDCYSQPSYLLYYFSSLHTLAPDMEYNGLIVYFLSFPSTKIHAPAQGTAVKYYSQGTRSHIANLTHTYTYTCKYHKSSNFDLFQKQYYEEDLTFSQEHI